MENREKAEACFQMGNRLALQNQWEQAEQQYLSALRIQNELLEQTKNLCYARAAEETSLCLADLCMEQGNMHGADRYYVWAMYFRAEENKI